MLVVAVAAVRLSLRSGLPSLLIYLGIGLVLGESGFGINYENQQLTQVLGYGALVLILVEGGLTTRWSGIRHSVAPAAVLATVGVGVSVVVVGVTAHLLLGWPWQVACWWPPCSPRPMPRPCSPCCAGCRCPADLRRAGGRVGLQRRARRAAGHRAGSRAHPRRHSHPWWQVGLIAVLELAGGAVVGLAVGWGGARLLRLVASTSSALFAIGVIAVAVLAYAVADCVHASGFLACYLAALVLGNLRLPHRPAVLGFATAIGWLAQIGLFVLLGLLAHPDQFLHVLVPALVVGVALLLLGRPASVFVSLLPFGMSWRTQAFLSWAGLRGAVPVVLATVPGTLGTPGVPWIFDLVFVLVVIFTLVQAPTLPWVARRLGLASPHHQVDLAVETTPLDDLGAELLEIDIGPGSRIAGVRVFELRLPVGANVSLVVREGRSFVPRDNDVLRHGDQMLVVAPSSVRALAENRLRAVSRGGRLADWP